MKHYITIALCTFLSQICTGQVMMLFSQDSLTGITSPADLDSLFYWFAADVGVLDSVGSPISNNQGVGQWNDLSGRGNHVANSTDRPIWIATGGPGNRPCIVFDSPTGTDQLIEIDSSYWNSDQFTIFVVWKVESATAAFQEYPFSRSPSLFNQQFAIYGEQSGNYRIKFFANGGSGLVVDEFGIQKSTTWKLYSLTATTNTNTSSLLVDGASQSIINNGTQTGIQDKYSWAWVGRRSQSISEIIVFSRALSATERTAIENYLNRKYDLY